MHFISVRQVWRAVVVAALAFPAAVFVAAGSASAAGTPCQQTFSSGAVNIAINDNATIVADINVPEDGLVVSDADVSVNIHHAYVSDLQINILSLTDALGDRGGTRLFNRELSDEPNDNLLGTIFDDEASTEIARGNAPFTGRFRPTRPLSALDNVSGGFYRLVVADQAVGDTGVLNNWAITLSYKSCDFDSDGVEDHADQCLGVSAHTASGCPLTTRALTAKYKHGKFQGVMSSPVAGCKASQPVTVWKVRRGADKLVGSATTRSDGSYKLTHAKHAGRYYATSPRVAVTDQAECPAVTSSTFRIR
jgi:subtilisin-like proprotein convertase family protein